MDLSHPASIKILGLPGQLFLLLIMALGFGFFLTKAYEAFRLIRLGQKENRIDDIPGRIKSVILYVLIQLRVFVDPFAGFMHAFIFWGFLVLSVGYGNAIISAFWKGFAFPLTKTKYFLVMHDFFAFMVLVAVVLALFRRLVLRPKRLEYTTEAILILCMIFCIVSFDFVSEGFKAAVEIKTGLSTSNTPFITELIGKKVSLFNMPVPVMTEIHYIFWWLHMMLIFSFMAYLPFSKHFHIVTAAINVFLRNLKPVGQLSTIDIENSESFGVTHINEFTWKNLFDLFVCTECGRCSDNCPAHLTEKPLSPKKVIQDLKEHLKSNAKTLLKPASEAGDTAQSQEAAQISDVPIVDTVLKPDTIWSCTTCGACLEACPVFIEHVPKIVDIRRSQVLMESKFPQEVVLTFKNMENNFNPYGIGFQNRADWCADLGVKILEEGAKSDILFFVGCAGAYDERNKRVSESIVKILKKSGVDFAILGTDEACCGDPARRIGNEYLYQTLVQQNIEHFKSRNVKKIIAHCPHCFNTLKNEYSQFKGDFEVMHTTTFIKELHESGKIKMKDSIAKNICYHDSCYLGRYNNLYTHPRDILKGIPGVKMLEMKKRREDSFCCGAGGGRMWMEETLGTRINKNRVEQALTTSPDIIALNCPYCMTMLTDGIKDMNMEEKVKVMDMMELVIESCGNDDKS